MWDWDWGFVRACARYLRFSVAHCTRSSLHATPVVCLSRFKPGVWVGVELFEPRGKHNGTVDGVQYFSIDPSVVSK